MKMPYRDAFFEVTVFSPQLREGKVRFHYVSADSAITALTKTLRKVFGVGLRLSKSIKVLEATVRRLETSGD